MNEIKIIIYPTTMKIWFIMEIYERPSLFDEEIFSIEDPLLYFHNKK